jgi:hypothetical protein
MQKSPVNRAFVLPEENIEANRVIGFEDQLRHRPLPLQQTIRESAARLRAGIWASDRTRNC